MFIRRLRLYAYRNYEQATLAPARGVTVLHGQNAQGKTNVIEAVYLCCVGRSHRTRRDGELVRWGERSARVDVEIERREGIEDVEVRIDADSKRKKHIRINASPVQRIGELMGHVNAVLFSPEDLRIVKEGPEVRRRFLDMEISQLYPSYFYALQKYFHTLNQRNGLLRHLAFTDSPVQMDTLVEWDQLLVEAGAEVISRRIAYLEKLGAAAAQIHASLSGQQESLQLLYQGRSHSREAFAQLIEKNRADDLRRASTSAGPHRDDYQIRLDGRDAKAFASQGQQRTIALSLKLAEIDVMRETLDQSPVLLLDDVMSELDISRRQMLLSRIGDIQTLITCTDLSDLGGADYDAAYQVQKGTLQQTK